MIWGFLRCQNPENSIGYFRKIVLSNAMPDSITLSVTISACHDLGNPNIGKCVHCCGFKRAFGNAHISQCNSFILFYSKINDIEYACKVFEGLVVRDLNERLSKAFDLLEEMELDGFKPDSVIMMTLISFCSKSKLLEHGQFIHGFVIRRELDLDLTVINSIWVHLYALKTGLEFNLHLINALLSMYCKCKDIKSAKLIFGSIPNQRNLCSWNSMISGYAWKKQPH
ncbi:hypothetical protein AMTRI_Chr08g206020 [Amborella trichopoda]